MYGSYVKEYAEEIRREAVMMVLVLGGSGSGKSAYAEELLCTLAGKSQTTKYYLAAMRVYDEEGARKVEKPERERLSYHRTAGADRGRAFSDEKRREIGSA